MAGRGKIFELLDFPKFAYPSVLRMDASQTSQNLIERLGGGGFMSYSSIWPRMAAIVEGRATETFIQEEFGFYSDDWKNDSIRDAVRVTGIRCRQSQFSFSDFCSSRVSREFGSSMGKLTLCLLMLESISAFSPNISAFSLAVSTSFTASTIRTTRFH
jgi:hypothetical protein